MLKTFFINGLKILVAAALIYWLINSGKLDLKLIARLKDYPFSVMVAVALSILNFILISYRWKVILNARSAVQLPITGLLLITWIGQFFSSVLPGSVSGDLVKILYVQKFDATFSKAFVFASIIIDRLMGLSGLILLVGISSFFFSSHILDNAPAMKPLLNMNYVLVSLITLSLLIFVFFHQAVRKILVKATLLIKISFLQRLIILWDDLVSIRSQMLKAVGFSIFVQLIGVVIFWSLIRPFIGDQMDFIQALAFIPLGLMTLALPIAPSGLGVGHAIFQKLFEFSGIDNGASLFNLYFVVTLSVNVCGVIPYLLTRVKK